MKTLIIYSSQTGFTKKYATWLSEELQADCIPLKDAKKINWRRLFSVFIAIFGTNESVFNS